MNDEDVENRERQAITVPGFVAQRPPADPTLNHRIIQNVPQKPNARINKERTTGRDVLVEWDRLELEPTCYVVTCTSNDGNETREPTTANEMRITVDPGHIYHISVHGENNGQIGTQSDKLFFRSAPLKPINLRVTQDADDTAIDINFEDADTEHRHKDFEISIDGKAIITINRTFHRCQDLAPGTRHLISLRALETTGDFNTFSSETEAQYFLLRPSPPETFQCIQQHGGYQATWSKVWPRQYTITWRSGSGVDCSTRDVESESYFFDSTDLKPGLRYTIHVYAKNEQEKKSRPLVTSFDTAPLEPTDICVRIVEGFYALVTFKGTQEKTSYTVVAEPIGGEDRIEKEAQWESAKMELKPGQDYSIHVFAKRNDMISLKASYGTHVHTCPAKVENFDVKNEGESVIRITWKGSEGATHYVLTLTEEGCQPEPHEAQEPSFLLREIDQKMNYIIKVEPVNDVGRGVGFEKRFLAELQMELKSTNAMTIKCDECSGAKTYDLYVNDEPPISNGEPTHTIELKKDCLEITVKVRVKNKDNVIIAESAFHTFRHVVKITREYFKKVAADIIDLNDYIKPQCEVTPNPQSNDPKINAAIPQSGELVVVKASRFSGKTALCSYCVQTISASNTSTETVPRLAILFDADAFSMGSEFNIPSFFREIIPDGVLSNKEVKTLSTWIEHYSEEVVFVVDNAPNPDSTSSPLASYNTQATVSRIFSELFKVHRNMFPKSGVLCTTHCDAQIQRYSRILEIVGFSQNEVEQMSLKVFGHNNQVVPEELNFLCISPGFCKTTMWHIKRKKNHRRLGECLIEILTELINQLPANKRTVKSESILRDISDNTRKLGNHFPQSRNQCTASSIENLGGSNNNVQENVVAQKPKSRAQSQQSTQSPSQDASETQDETESHSKTPSPNACQNDTVSSTASQKEIVRQSASEMQSCKYLEEVYETVLFYAYFMPTEDFKNCLEEELRKNQECQMRKWTAIASLLREDHLWDGNLDEFQQVIKRERKDPKKKRKIFKEFFKKRKHEIEKLVLEDGEFAANLMFCIRDSATLKEFNFEFKKAKNDSQKENLKLFHQKAPPETRYKY